MPTDRRRFLRASGATALATAAACANRALAPSRAYSAACLDAPRRAPASPGASRDPFDLPERDANFPLGVMAGDAREDRAVLWTRYDYTGGGTLGLRVRARDGGAPGRVVFDGPVRATAEGLAHAELRGLEAGTRYEYAFVVRDRAGDARVRSPVGCFRTAPARDALEPVTFAGTSCTHVLAHPFPVLRAAAACASLDFFVHAGDHAYCDGAHDLDEFRLRYRETWTAAGMKALHATSGLYATWDDHEISNNWDPETTPRALVSAARRAFFEHHPLARDAGEPERIYRSYRWGRAVELFVLDCRGERRPSTRRTPHAQYLSPAQLAWLTRGLAESTARFKLVVNSVPITDFPGLLDLGAADRWEGYPAQREALLAFIADRGIANVWFLSGDFH